MKKYVVILALLLFGKAEAQKTYPKIHADTAVAIVHYGDSAIITRTKTTTVIDSEITASHEGIRIVIPTKETIHTVILSQKMIMISKEVSTKITDVSVIDDYLLHGKQIDPSHVMSLKHGALKISRIFYIKNNTLYYYDAHTFSVGSIVDFILFFLIMVLADLVLFVVPSKNGKVLWWHSGDTVFGIGIGIVVGLIMLTEIGNGFGNGFWDEAPVPIIVSPLIFFSVNILRNIYLRYQQSQVMPHGGGGNA